MLLGRGAAYLTRLLLPRWDTSQFHIPMTHGGQQRHLLVAGSQSSQCNGASARDTTLQFLPLQHPQPGAAAAALSNLGSRRFCVESASQRLGNRSGAGWDELTSPPAKQRSPNQLQMRRARASGAPCRDSCAWPAVVMQSTRWARWHLRFSSRPVVWLP